jgi:hypothetical protein
MLAHLEPGGQVEELLGSECDLRAVEGLRVPAVKGDGVWAVVGGGGAIQGDGVSIEGQGGFPTLGV